ncbi:MAG: alpha/beta fold hydrolase [Anaerolineales bacterium]|nr:alpha/beta fold hydrolase [Anaerolineales bacterium]
MPTNSYFPSEHELMSAKAGDLILKPGVYEVEGEQFQADYGTLVVLENRSKPVSKLIHLPIVWVHAPNATTSPPIFILGGGPGESNISTHSKWFYENHDLVMVGYRGVDGSVVLDCPGIFEGLTQMEYPLSGENQALFGRRLLSHYQRLIDEGIDLDSYTLVDVVDDLEATRDALGFHELNLWAISYGTHVAFVCCVRYPERIHRCMMTSPGVPGRMGFWEARVVDALLDHYAELWSHDSNLILRSPDLTGTLRNVIRSLPVQWRDIRVDPDKVKAMSFLNLYNTASAAQVFDAFVAAEEGDYSGLAFLSSVFDQALPGMFTWGDHFSKLYCSSDIYGKREYEAVLDSPESILGSPISMFNFVTARYGGWPIRRISDEYRSGPSQIETLLVNGNIDPVSPLEYTRDFLMPKLTNGRLVVLAEMGHTDICTMQPEAYGHLCETFFLTGDVDDSEFNYSPMNFAPQITFQDEAKNLLQ